MTVQIVNVPVYVSEKIFKEGKKQYVHRVEDNRQIYHNKKAYRRALSKESGGAWIEEKVGKKRYFVDQSSWFQTTFRQVSKDEFYAKLDVPSTWQKVFSLGLLTFQQKNLAFALAGCTFIPSWVVAQASGTEFQVNTNTSGNQQSPSIASHHDGGFIVTWQSEGQDGNSTGIFGQRFDVNGVRFGNEFQINNYTIGSQSYPKITSKDDGEFIVTWQSYGQDGDNSGIYGQRYDINNTRNGTEFRANSNTVNAQRQQSIVSLTDGRYVIAWSSYGQGGFSGVYAQSYYPNGLLNGSEFRVSTFSNSLQGYPSVCALNNGTFVVTWASYYQDGSYDGVFGQRYDGRRARNGTEFRVNTNTGNNQNYPSSSLLKDICCCLAKWRSKRSTY